MGITLLALLTHPEQLEEVKADRSLLPDAVEEGLRWNPTAPYFYRMVMKDTEFYGHHIPAGDVMELCLGPANRDPSRWDDPDAFDPYPTVEQFEVSMMRLARRIPHFGIPNRPTGLAAMYDVAEVAAMIAEGKTLVLAGCEAALDRLPRGRWIAGTTPYFMTAEQGGVVDEERLFVHPLPDEGARLVERQPHLQGGAQARDKTHGSLDVGGEAH